MKTEREMLPMKGYRSVVVAAVVLGLGLNLAFAQAPVKITLEQAIDSGAEAQPHLAGCADHHPTEPGRGNHGLSAPEPDDFHRLGIPADLETARRVGGGVSPRLDRGRPWGEFT